MKKKRAPARLSTQAVLDEILNCCDRVETLAGFMEMSDWLQSREPLNPRLIEQAGYMITEQMTALRRWLKTLYP